jgi:hypothetical protein
LNISVQAPACRGDKKTGFFRRKKIDENIILHYDVSGFGINATRYVFTDIRASPLKVFYCWNYPAF